VYKLWKELLRRPWAYRLALRLGRVLRLWARDGWLKQLPPRASGWTAARNFPAPARHSFRQLWARKKEVNLGAFERSFNPQPSAAAVRDKPWIKGVGSLFVRQKDSRPLLRRSYESHT